MVIVIRDKSGFSVIPTVILSILKFRDLNRLVILKRTPGLFSTMTDRMYILFSLSSSKIVFLFFCILYHAPIIMSLRPVPGATNGYTSSSGSIGMSITVAISDLTATLSAFSNSSIEPTLCA